ncbi:MAG: hypothetical protein AB1757_23380 [Acidobacteriota bacterium]
MKYKISLLFLLIAGLLSNHPIAGFANSETQVKRPRTDADYRLSTLKEINTIEPKASLLPFKVKVNFTGSTRPIAPSARELIRRWANLHAGSPDHYIVPYDTEMLFVEGSTEHWLVINKNLLPKFQESVKQGEAVELYLLRMGETATNEKPEWLWLVERFKEVK